MAVAAIASLDDRLREGLVDHAQDELWRAGLLDADSDYGGMLGKAALALVRLFAEQGHSGFSAAMTTELFGKLARYEPLTPLTDDPAEWQHIDADVAGDATTWQSRRRPDAFSNDGGATYYCLDDPENYRPGTVEDIDPDGGSDEPPARVQKPRDQWRYHRSLPAAVARRLTEGVTFRPLAEGAAQFDPDQPRGPDGRWTKYPRAQLDVFEHPDYTRRGRMALSLAKRPVPGTVMWRGETRAGDVSDAAASVGGHWTVDPGGILISRRDDLEPGHRAIIWQAALDDPQTAIPRSSMVWSGRSRSMDWEAEVRLRPDAPVRVVGAWEWTGDGPAQGYPAMAPTWKTDGDPGWTFHPLDDVTGQVRYGGHIDYADQLEFEERINNDDLDGLFEARGRQQQSRDRPTREAGYDPDQPRDAEGRWTRVFHGTAATFDGPPTVQPGTLGVWVSPDRFEAKAHAPYPKEPIELEHDPGRVLDATDLTASGGFSALMDIRDAIGTPGGARVRDIAGADADALRAALVAAGYDAIRLSDRSTIVLRDGRLRLREARHFDPDQPRWPSGAPDGLGGQWRGIGPGRPFARAADGPDLPDGGDEQPRLPSAEQIRQALAFDRTLGEHRWRADVVTVDRGTDNAEVSVDVLRDGEQVGYARRAFFLDGAGGLALFHDSLELEEHQGEGFGGAYVRHTIGQARELGATHVILAAAHPGGGYAWARAGFMVDAPAQGVARPSIERLAAYQREGMLDLFDRARGVLDEQPGWPDGLADDLDEIRAAIEDRRIAAPFELAAWGRGAAGYEWPYDYEGTWERVTRTEKMHAAKILLRASDWAAIRLLR